MFQSAENSVEDLPSEQQNAVSRDLKKIQFTNLSLY